MILTLSRPYIRIIERVLNVFFFGSLILVISLQVLFRYTLNIPLHWTEELSLYFLAWVTFFGSYVAARNDKHLSILILVNALPNSFQAILRCVSSVLACFCMTILTWEGVRMAYILADTVSPTIGFPLIFMYIVVPFNALLMLMVYLFNAVANVRDLLHRGGK